MSNLDKNINLFGFLNPFKKKDKPAPSPQKREVGVNLYLKDGPSQTKIYMVDSWEEEREKIKILQAEMDAATSKINEAKNDDFLNILGIVFQKRNFSRICIFQRNVK